MNIRGSWWYFGTQMEPVYEHHILRRDDPDDEQDEGTVAIRVRGEQVEGDRLVLDYVVVDDRLADGPAPPGVTRPDRLTSSLASYIIRMTLVAQALRDGYRGKCDRVLFRDAGTGFEEEFPL